jgi:hypothetical protein
VKKENKVMQVTMEKMDYRESKEFKVRKELQVIFIVLNKKEKKEYKVFKESLEDQFKENKEKLVKLGIKDSLEKKVINFENN